MSKRMKRVVSLILAILTVITSFTMTAFASVDGETEEISPYYSVIISNASSLEINGIKATCSAVVSAPASTKLSIKMELQKKSSGVYSTVKTWTASRVGSGLTMSESRNINILYTYRLKTTFNANDETVVVFKYAS